MPGSSTRIHRLIESIVPEPILRMASRALPAFLKRAVAGAVESKLFAGVETRLERRSAEKVKAATRAISRGELDADLAQARFPPAAVVFVHSSLSRLGFIEGGAETVIAALQRAMGPGGTLAMPAFTMAGTMENTMRSGSVFDVRQTPSGMGKITEALRCVPGARRSVHPTHSVTAVGPRADWLTEAHHLDPHPFGRQSPLGRLLEADGWVMGLGTDLGTVTFYHVVEDLEPAFPRRVYTPDSPLSARCVDEAGAEHDVKVMTHDPAQSMVRIDKPGGIAIRALMTRHLTQHHGLRHIKVGASQAWIIRAGELYRGTADLMRRGITIYSAAEALPAGELERA